MLGNFDYDTLTLEYRQEVHDALAATTVKHISSNGDLFSEMPFDAARSPSQMLEVVHLQPAPSRLQEVHDLADIANGPLAEVTRDALRSQPAYLGAIRFLMDESNENIVCLTGPHKNIADVALWESGWVENIEQEDWQDRNGLGISRGVTTIQAFGMAASEVVQKMGHVFLSFPKTKTIEDTDIDPDLIATNNKTMRSEARGWMNANTPRWMRRDGGKALHLAGEGKTTEVVYGDDHKPESIRLGKIANGTLSLVKGAVVQPVTIWEGSEPAVVIGDLTEVKNKNDILRVQSWQADTLSRIIGISRDKISIEV